MPVHAYVDGVLAVDELRRDRFAWGYFRSCGQRTVVPDSTVPPDPIRLRYRPELSAVVREPVLAKAAPRPAR